MLYEQIIPYETAKCIHLSECMEQSEESTALMEQYLQKFREMLSTLTVHRRTPLKMQPLFRWHDRTSACWKFEEQRIMHSLHGMLMSDAKQCFDNCDYKGAKQLLGRAVEVCKEMLSSEWVKTPSVYGMPEIQLPYMMSLLMRTKGTYCFNMHSFKCTPKAAQLAYQLVELSNCLWRRGADIEYSNKLKAHYHYAVASTSEDFKEIISHSTAAVELLKDPKMLEDHANWLEKNNTVHYETVEEVSCPTITLEKALRIV